MIEKPVAVAQRLVRAWPHPWRRLRTRVRSRLARAARPASVAAPVSDGAESVPVLSVIVPIFEVEEYLDEALWSALRQTWRALEVIVVDDGSTDGGPAIVEAHRARDPRVRLIRQPNAGQGTARNRGIAAARGEYLVFLDGDDVVPRTAYASMIKTLRRTGSDFVLAPVSRLRRGGRLTPPTWNEIVFDRRRLATTIDEFPEAMLDVLACNRMFRRDFWVDHVGSFRGGIAYEDHLPMVSALLRARAFDVITDVCYHWRIRADGTSTTQQKQSLGNLRDRIGALAETFDLISREASPAVRSLWIAKVLDFDLFPYVSYALDSGPEYRRLVQAGYARYLGAADATALDHVRVDRKITAHLAAAGRWEAVGRLRAGRRRWGQPPPAVPRRGRLEVRADVARSTGVRLPANVCTLSRYESVAVGCLSDLAWHGSELELEGWALIKNLDDAGSDPVLRAWLDDGAGRIPLQVVPLLTPEATVWARDRHARHDRCGFRLTVTEETLTLVRTTDRGPWRLVMTIEHRDLLRAVATWSVLAGSRAVRRSLPRHVDGDVAVAPRFDREQGLVLERVPRSEVVTGESRLLSESVGGPGGTAGERAVPMLVDLDAKADLLTLTVHGGPLSAREVRTLRLVGRVASVPAASARSGGVGLQTWAFRLTEARFGSPRPLPLGTYTVRFDQAGIERRLHVDPYAELALPCQVEAGAHRVSAGIGPDGTLTIALQSALRTDERGEWAQQRLLEFPPSPLLTARSAVLFLGTDGPSRGALATLAEALVRRHPKLRVHWEVTDPAADLPAGVISVPSGSRAWYALAAQAAALCSGRPAERSSPLIEARQNRLLVLAEDTAGVTGRWSSAAIDGGAWPHVLTLDPGLADRVRDGGYDGDLLVGRLPVPGLPGPAETPAQIGARIREILQLGATRVVWHVTRRGSAAELTPLLANMPLGGRLLVWSPSRLRLPEHPQLVDATGWLSVAELLLTADDVVAPAEPNDAAWRVIDPDAVEVWTRIGSRSRRTALPLVPAANVVAALGWLAGPSALRRQRLLDRAVEALAERGGEAPSVRRDQPG